MKSLLSRIAITSCILIFSNYIFSNSHLSSNSSFTLEQETQDERIAKKEKENTKINNEAIDFLNGRIKKLEKNKKTDKAEALKAMRDYIKRNLKGDPGTIIDRAADEGKKTANGKDNKKAIKEYIDKTHSATAKKVFNLNFVATGTGRTTGHIADLTITNNSDYYISLIPETVFIPSKNRYQSYVSHVPDLVTIAPGTTATIPIHGYCADPHIPPVPNNESMPSPSEWIPTNVSPEGGFELDGNPPMIPEPMNPPGGSTGPPHHTIPIHVSDAPTLPSFDPEMINIVKSSPGFTEDNDSGTESEIQITFPGTTEEVGGTIDPEKDPEIFAQVTIEALFQIIANVDTIQNSGLFITPFSNDREKEKEALIQQAFWIFVAGLVGNEYEKEDFTNNVYKQFETATGKSVTSLPPEQKEQVDGGVDNFWTVYVAVGAKAKVINIEDSPTIPISNPEEVEEVETGCCKPMFSHYYNPKLDFDMKIADQWANASERRNLIKKANESMKSDINILEGEGFEEYDISKNPTSATSFWKTDVVGGFASAHAKTWFNKSDGSWEWVWGTKELDTDAGGTMNNTLSYNTGDSCRAIVAGTALIRIKASSSAFDPVAGNRHNENDKGQLEFVKGVKYTGKLALEYLIMRGRGKTKKTFGQFVKDEIKDDIKEEISNEIEAEVQKLAEAHLGEYLDALGLEAEDLNRDMFDLEKNLEKLLGVNIPTAGDIENALSEAIDASLNLFFVSSTYATAEGRLKVKVGSKTGVVGAYTSAIYGRGALETTDEAMHWTGNKCQEKQISDVQPNSLSISTEGYVNMISEAVSEYGFGNGSAKAFLESMNLQMLVGLCIYEENDSTIFKIDAFASLHWFGNSNIYQDELKGALEHLKNDIQDSLSDGIVEFQSKPGNSSLENYTGEMLKNTLDLKIRKWASDHLYYWKNCTN